MCKTSRNCGREALKKLTLALIKSTKLFSKSAIRFFCRNLFERTTQISQPSADSPCRQLASQTSEALVDGGAHRREPHELLQAPLLRGLNEIVHSNASDSSNPSSFRIRVGGHPEIHEKWCPSASRFSNFRQRLAVEHWLATASCENERAELRRVLTELVQRHSPTANRLRKLFGRLNGAIDYEERYSGAMQDHPAAPCHGRNPNQGYTGRFAINVPYHSIGGQIGE
jgi:hypothetical protein